MAESDQFISQRESPSAPSDSLRWAEWLSTLRGLAGEIDVFMAVSGQTFTDLVSELRGGMDEALDLTERSCDMLEVLSEDVLSRIHTHFAEQLDLLEMQADAVGQSPQWTQVRTAVVRSLFEQLQSTQSELAAIITALNSLGVTVVTRVSRCAHADAEQQEGMHQLRAYGAKVATLTRTVQEKCTELFTGLGYVIDMVDADRRARSKAVHETLASLCDGIELFKSAQRLASEATLELSYQAQVINTSIESVVRSAQIHDISHQRLAHVRDSIVRVAEYLRARQRTGRSLGHVPTLLYLQQAQMLDAKEEFVSAIDSLEDQLGQVEGEVLAIAEQLGRLSLRAGSGSTSLFDDLRSRVMLVLDAVRASTKHDMSLNAHLADLEPRTADVQHQTESVLATAAALDALAAQLLRGCSAHGSCCAMLQAKLSGEVTQVVQAASPLSRRLSELARQATTVTRSMSLADSGPTKRAVAALDELMESLLAEIEGASRELRDSVFTLRTQAMRLARRLTGAMSTFSIQRRFEVLVHTLDATFGALEREAAGSEELTSVDACAAFEELIVACAATYTMHAERRVLARVLKSADRESLVVKLGLLESHHDVTSTPCGMDHDFGTNVELF